MDIEGLLPIEAISEQIYVVVVLWSFGEWHLTTARPNANDTNSRNSNIHLQFFISPTGAKPEDNPKTNLISSNPLKSNLIEFMRQMLLRYAGYQSPAVNNRSRRQRLLPSESPAQLNATYRLMEDRCTDGLICGCITVLNIAPVVAPAVVDGLGLTEGLFGSEEAFVDGSSAETFFRRGSVEPQQDAIGENNDGPSLLFVEDQWPWN